MWTNLGIQRQDQNDVPNLNSDIYIESTCQYKSNKHVIKVKADPDQEIWDDSNVHSSWARASDLRCKRFRERAKFSSSTRLIGYFKCVFYSDRSY